MLDLLCLLLVDLKIEYVVGNRLSKKARCLFLNQLKLVKKIFFSDFEIVCLITCTAFIQYIKDIAEDESREKHFVHCEESGRDAIFLLSNYH